MLFVIFAPDFCLAQDGIDEGLTAVGEETGLQAEDPRIVIARIIRIFLGFLGVIAIAIIIYGGFLYMTSGGAPNKVEQARKVLINALIGLIIIILSFAITSYILNRFQESLGVGGGGGGDGQIVTPGGGGTSVAGGFSVSIQPKGDNRPITSIVKVVFPTSKEPLTANENQNIKDNIKVYSIQQEDEEPEIKTQVAGTFTVDGRQINFVPEAQCPAGCQKENCFESNTKYRVEILSGLRSTDNDSVACPDALKGYCRAIEFTTGDQCDMDGPSVRIYSPTLPIRQGDLAEFDTFSQDDGGLSVVEMCFDPENDSGNCELAVPESETESLTELSYIFDNFTDEYELGWHEAQMTASDLSDNEKSINKKYLIASDACFDEDDNFDCNLPDCEIEECISSDEDGVPYVCYEQDGKTICEPWSFPIITSITPDTGGSNIFVTIRGLNFGAYEENVSKVEFNGVQAGLACGEESSWSNSQVIVQVPQDATTGSIKLIGSKGYNDTGNESSPGWKGEFVVTEEEAEWIGLCSVTNSQTNQSSGKVSDLVDAIGENFGDDKEDLDLVYFDGIRTNFINSWSNEQIDGIKIPNVEQGTTLVQVGKDTIYSNPINFSITESQSDIRIDSVSPNPAPPDQYITIIGQDFGYNGAVNFIGDEGTYVGLLGCDGAWQDDQLTIQLPSEIPDGDYILEIVSGNANAQTDFRVDSSLSVRPGICDINPDNGPAGMSVSINGSDFGSEKGQVFFSNEVKADLSEAEWTDTNISNIIVPAGAQTGDIYLTNLDEEQSNKINFSVKTCFSSADCDEGEICCNRQYCSAPEDCSISATSCEYSWYFSTGNLPKVPKIIERSCVPEEYNESPSPYKNSSQACPNSLIAFTFNMQMQEETILDKVIIKKCLDPDAECKFDTCGEIDSNCVVEDYNLSLTEDFSVSNYPAEDGEEVTEVILTDYDLVPSTSYQVTVQKGALSEQFLELVDQPTFEMPNDYTWTFTTRAQNCNLQSVLSSPASGLLTSVVDEQKFKVTGQSENCGIIDVSQYSWQWSIERFADRIVKLTKPDLPNNISYFGVNQSATEKETPQNSPGLINAFATINDDEYYDVSKLVVRFTRPKVVDYWPDCNEACRNAMVGADFNTYIKADDLLDDDNVRIYQCLQSECDLSGMRQLKLNQPGQLNCWGENADLGCTQLQIFKDLKPATYYRVVISQDIQSISDYNLEGLNYSFFQKVDENGNIINDSFSWIFKTRDSEEYCRLDTVEVLPSTHVTSQIGEKIEYFAVGLGAPDVCSDSGQKLDSYQYNWNWSSDKDGKPASENKLIELLTVSYDPVGTGGCSDICLNSGSSDYEAVCGNNILEAGEECEDGNIFDNDGCSSACLNEGVDSDLCGNNRLDEGEECDDGDRDSGDGCSSVCLNEGSSASGFNCGNGEREFGEDADFGPTEFNQKFGLNSQCLFVGADYTIDDEVSICGDKQIGSGEECEARDIDCLDPNGETCVFGQDDYCVCDFEDNPYCSDTCLLIGFPVCGEDEFESCCGNGVIENYENYVSEECEADCRREGPYYFDPRQPESACQSFIENFPDQALQDKCTYDEEQGAYYVLASIPCEAGSEQCVCEMPDWCTDNCMNKGSDFTYDSFCNDGELGNGEDPACEQGILTQKYGSPYAIVNVLGELPDGQISDLALINATADNVSFDELQSQEEITNIEKKNGFGELTYYWDGSEETSPCEGTPAIESSPNGQTLCINAAFDIVFDKKVRPADNVWDANNIRIGYDADQCDEMAQADMSIGQKFVYHVKKTFYRLFGLEARAAFCPDMTFEVKVRQIEDDKTKISIINKNLDGDVAAWQKNASYSIQLSDLTDACGVSIRNIPNINVNTSDNYCHFDTVEVIPAYHLFTQVGEEVELIYHAKSGAITIFPIKDIYSWSWGTWVSEDSSIVAVNSDKNLAVAQNNVGLTTVSVEAEITTDVIFNESTQKREGSGSFEVFLCQEPWFWPNPDHISGLADKLDEKANIRLMYCRDQGNVNDITDDLPWLDDKKGGENEDQILTEYFFLRGIDPKYASNDPTNDLSPDAISIRVYANPDNLSARGWYNENVPNKSGNVVEMKFACDFDSDKNVETCYHGVRDENTVYISAGNLLGAGKTLYNNIYVLGYSQGANSKTTNIFSQILENIRFNANLLENNAVAYQPIKRDIKRVNDINYIKSLLQNYYQVNNEYPDLQAGSYVRGVTVSSWPSWQSILGNQLGAGLPTDPLNNFEEYWPSSSNEGAECPESTVGLRCLEDNHQCYVKQDKYVCSICAPDSDPLTCYNSTDFILGLPGNDNDQISKIWDSTSYIYGYNHRKSELYYNLEGLGEYYDGISGLPSDLSDDFSFNN